MGIFIGDKRTNEIGIVEITSLAIEIMNRLYANGYRYLVRDCKSIYAFRYYPIRVMPVAGIGSWVSESNSDGYEITPAIDVFPFVRHDDDFPTEIEEVLQNGFVPAIESELNPSNSEKLIKWIPILDSFPEDHLPERSDIKEIKVLTCTEGENSTVIMRSRRMKIKDNGEHGYWRWSGENISLITHWAFRPDSADSLKHGR